MTYETISSVRMTYDVTLSDVIKSLVKVVRSVQHLFQQPVTFNAFPLLSGAVWEKWFYKMAAPYHYDNVQK